MMTVEMAVMKAYAVREYVCTCTHVNILHMLLGTEKAKLELLLDIQL